MPNFRASSPGKGFFSLSISKTAILRLGILGALLGGGIALAMVLFDGANIQPRSVDPALASGSGACANCNLILISIDTLRADHLPCYGYERDTSPEICAFFEDHIRFEQAFSQSSWTAPAHASMFTGLYPARHGVTYGPMIPRLKGFPTIFSVLQEAGYYTISLDGGAFINPVIDVSHVDYRKLNAFRRVAPQDPGLIARIESALDQKAAEQPFLLFLHGYDVHIPYAPRRNLYAEVIPEFDQQARENRYCRYTNLADKSVELDAETVPKDPSAYRYMRSLYDSEIHEVDQDLGKLFGFLGERELLENSVVILTSDHGEEFGEHGSCEHIKTVYNELIQVPLFMRWPGGGAQVISEPVAASVSILPTVLDILSIELPATTLDGESLFAGAPDWIFSEAQFFWDSDRLQRYAAIAGGHKLVVDVNRSESRLYDLREDWRETQDVRADREEAFGRSLEEALDRYIESGGVRVQTKGELSDKTLEELRSLGYIE